MTYKAKVKREGHHGILEIDGILEMDYEESGTTRNLTLYLEGLEKDSNDGLADSCLSALYDHHQVSDDFKENDEIDVEGVGTFVAHSFHILPTSEEMMTRREKKYGVKYEGIDGVVNTGFDDLKEAAKYVKARWEGIDYCDSPTNFHNDYGQFYLRGFELKDVGEFYHEAKLDCREFKFND